MFDRKLAVPTRRHWYQPTTMAELGKLTAAWLRGNIDGHPGYNQPHNLKPDPITLAHPGLISTLIACNQAGFVTTPRFQAGFKDQDWDGATFQAISAVQGFLSWPLAETLIQVVEDRRFGFIEWGTPRPRWHLFGGHGETVATRNGKPYLVFGRRMSRKDIRKEYYPCQPKMIEALATSVQLTIFQETVGVHDMWPALAHWAAYSR